VIKKLFLGLDTSGTYQVNITSNDPLFVSPSALSVAATANTFGTAGVAFPTPVELPFWSESLPYRFLEYYISFDRDGALPLNNKFLCCGKSYGWQNHMEVTGFNEDTQTPSESGGFSSYAHGLVLDGYMACEELDWICEVDELNGYFLKDVLARTIQFRGAAIAISALIDTVQVSPCTGYQLENLNSKTTYLNQRYRDNIAWIAENLPAGITDCFTCKPGNKFSRAKIIT